MNQTLVFELVGGRVTVGCVELAPEQTLSPRYAAMIDGRPSEMLVKGVSRYLADAAAHQFNKLAEQARRECRATVTKL